MSSEAGLIALIEHLRASGVCSHPRRVIIMRRKDGGGKAEIFFPPCKTWSCPECGERNKHRWKHRVMYGVDHYQKQGKEFSFVTITLGGKYKARDDSILGWRVVWPRVYDRFRRVFGRQPYAIIPECHRNGRVHLHMLIAGRAPERWWKDNVYGCGGGYIADSQPFDRVSGVVVYFTKYLAKGMALQQWPDNFKRIRVSHNWPKHPEKPTQDDMLYSIVHPKSLDWTIQWLWRMGYDVRNGVDGEKIEFVDL